MKQGRNFVDDVAYSARCLEFLRRNPTACYFLDSNDQVERIDAVEVELLYRRAFGWIFSFGTSNMSVR